MLMCLQIEHVFFYEEISNQEQKDTDQSSPALSAKWPLSTVQMTCSEEDDLVSMEARFGGPASADWQMC